METLKSRNLKGVYAYLPSSNQYHLHVSWASCGVASANNTIVLRHNHSVLFWCWPKTRLYCMRYLQVLFVCLQNSMRTINFLFNKAIGFKKLYSLWNYLFDYWSFNYCHCGGYGAIRLLRTPSKSCCLVLLPVWNKLKLQNKITITPLMAVSVKRYPNPGKIAASTLTPLNTPLHSRPLLCPNRRLRRMFT